MSGEAAQVVCENMYGLMSICCMAVGRDFEVLHILAVVEVLGMNTHGCLYPSFLVAVT